VSIGVAALDAGSRREYTELMAAADAALYRAKADGRDQVQMISTTRGVSASGPDRSASGPDRSASGGTASGGVTGSSGGRGIASGGATGSSGGRAEAPTGIRRAQNS
jgi:hypothetical protein